MDREHLQRLQMYKMAELGVMSSMVLHEIRQPLFAIKGYVQMLLLEAHQRGTVDQRLPRMLELVEDLENTSTSYLDFSRHPQDYAMPLELRVPLEAAQGLLKGRLKRARVDLHLEVPSILPLVKGNPGTLKQVLVNLLLNAVDALEARDLGDRHLWLSIRQPSEELVELTVADNGSGIPADIRDRIFDYFFTTKPEGKGTGLGLAISQEIVRAHGGSLSLVDSSEACPDWRPAPVTVFRVTLPALINSR